MATPLPTQARSSISAFVICCNEEAKIRRCLESLSWCDELLVIDSGSTDRTLEICREFTSKIIQRPWPGHRAQKSFGLAECKSEWVINIDADEQVSPELRAEILEKLETDGRSRLSENGFLVPRSVFYLGKWWKRGGWYPEYRMRFFRQRETSWGGEDPHEKAIVQGRIGRLKGEIFHFTYTDFSDQVRSLNSLTTVAARSLHQKGCRTSLLAICTRPVARFFKFYFLRKGFLEGREGFFVALLESWSVFLKYLKLWELSRRSN